MEHFYFIVGAILIFGHAVLAPAPAGEEGEEAAVRR